MRPSSPRLSPVVRLGFLVIALLAGLTGCGSRRMASRDAGPPALPRPTLRIAFVTDVKGYLEPCGCTSRPLGGLHRLIGTLGSLGRQGVPTALVATGDLLFPGDSDEAQAQQDRWQAETLIDILDGAGLAALVPGRLDRVRGIDTLAALETRSRAPWLGAAAGAPAGLTLAPSHTVDLGGHRVAFVGITDAFDATTDALTTAAREEATRVRAAGAELVVVLLRGDRRLARALGMLPGVDFVVHGGLDGERPEPPTARGRAFVLEGGRQGQRLAVLDVYLRDATPMRDESRYSRRVRRERLLAEAEERSRQIARWEREGGASAADLEAQRGVLATLRADAHALDREPDVAHGNAFVLDVIELAQGAPEDARVAERIEAFAARANDHNRVALAGLLPPAVPEGAATYVGSAACQRCHEAAYTWWRGHLHGRAYQTLVDRHREYNLQCVSCHVTGYGRPGGATVTHNLDGALIHVGCESCHGPGSLHVASPEAPGTGVEGPVPESTCTGCHTPEHSDHFDFATYRPRILVPGHGLGTGGNR